MVTWAKNRGRELERWLSGEEHDCPCRGPGFSSQPLYGCSQLLVTSIWGTKHPHLTSEGSCRPMAHIHVLRHTYADIKKKIKEQTLFKSTQRKLLKGVLSGLSCPCPLSFHLSSKYKLCVCPLKNLAPFCCVQIYFCRKFVRC